MPRSLNKPPRKSRDQVLARVNYLYRINEPYMSDRSRIRALMNGGKAAVEVLLKDLSTNDETLPAANHIKSGIERLSEMIAPPPDLRVDPPSGSDKDKHLRASEKRERIVESYDERSRLTHQLAQGSLWLVGYGFFPWKVCNARDRNGYRFPKAELRDPFTAWPAEWGVDQRPIDIAFQRWVDVDTLEMVYPDAKEQIRKASMRGLQHYASGAVDLSTYMPTSRNTTPGWDGNTGGVELIEYVDGWGTYVYSPAMDDFLDVYEHPLDRAPITVPRRFTFDTLHGHFDDVIGLATAMAKFTLLTQIAMEDAVLAPVVVSGRMEGSFKKGRDAVNYIEGGDAKYLMQNVPYQMFQEIDRLEAHLRSNTGYSQQADGESPISFVTGQGLQELGSSLQRQVERYQLVLKESLQDKDSAQLEWDERAFKDEKRYIEGTRRGEEFSEEYVPSTDIAGRWRTRRVYGIMAGLDEAQRGVAMLQYLAANVIDDDTVRENLRDIDNPTKVKDRILKGRIDDTLFEMLNGLAGTGEPEAIAAITRIRKNPKKMQEVLDEFFDVEEEPQPVAAEQPTTQDQFAQVLTRLTAGGQAQGGVQTQREIAGGRGRAVA